MTEILFIVQEDQEGYHAQAVGAKISTHADTRDRLIKNVRAAVLGHYDSPELAPRRAHLHYVHDETITIASGSNSQQSDDRTDIVEKLRGSVLKDDDPFGPAAPPEDWEAMR